MKIGFSNKLKIWTVVTIVIAIVGISLFGFLGFNQTADYSSAYELTATVEENIGDAGETMQKTAIDFLNEKGIKYQSFAVQKVNDGETVIFKFNGDSEVFSDKTALDGLAQDLKTKIESAFSGSSAGLNVTVSAYSTVHRIDDKIGYVILAAGIALVAIFVYALIMEKLSGALTSIIVGLISACLTFALIVSTRIPAHPFALSVIFLSAVLGSILSLGTINRCKELITNVGNNKASYKEIAEKASSLGFSRYLFIGLAIIIASLIFVAIGPTYFRFLGLQILVAGVSAVFTALGWTEILWASFKSMKKDRKKKENTEENK